jgi:signal recognition particle subunit SRP68
LQLLLFEAERLYAYAQELYKLKEHHKAIAKHRRSLSWANRLLSLCLQLTSKQFSAANLCEVLVYVHTLTAKLSFKRDQFDLAVKHHSVAYYLLILLQSVQRSSRDQALANLFIDEISPEIRFSAHELGMNRAHDVPKLAEATGSKYSDSLIPNFEQLFRNLEIEQARENTAGASEELRARIWEGEVIPIRNPELVDVLLKVQQADTKMESSEQDALIGRPRIKAYDPILQAWTDAEDVARKLMEGDQVG